MHVVFGSVSVKETGLGIPGLTVTALDVAAAASSQDAWMRLGSSITDAEGAFRLEYILNDVQDGSASRRRVDLMLVVSAPEETAGAQEPLFASPAVRRNVSAQEAFQVRIPLADLEKAGVGPPGDAADGAAEPPDRMRERLVARAARDVAVSVAEREARTFQVESAREELAHFVDEVRPALAARLSAVGPEQTLSDAFVPARASVRGIERGVMDADLAAVINRGGSRPRAVARIALTEEQAGAVRDRLDDESKIAVEDLRALLSAETEPRGPGYSRVDVADEVRRSPSAREEQARRTLEAEAPGEPIPAPGDVPGTGVEVLETTEVPQFLARLVDTMTSPEEAVLAGLEPRATQGRVAQSMRELAFEPSPADTPAFYDFHNLQVAFRHVWQEAIDEGVLDLAESAYNEIVLAGGRPHLPGVTADPVLGLRREAAAMNLARRRGSVGTLAKPGPGARAGLLGTVGPLDPVLTAHPDGRDGGGGDRATELIAELEQRLQEPYAFTTFAANRKERSVNFGILVTYRQRWEPLAYQAGRLAKTITLAPKEVQKYTRTVKRQRKRAEREVENHLRVRKEELSVTARAEEEIVRKANTKTNFHLSSESGNGPAATATSTMKTSFDLDAARTSETVKRGFRESVVKAAQEFKDELTVEVNTEDVEAFEFTESGELSNPNDEIACTFLFYELQRRYRVSERIHRLTEVVLVAQEMPAPHEINEAWLVSHDWILRRVLLDDSFAPALDYLSQRVVGDRAALAEMRVNVAQQRQLIATLQRELTVVRTRLATYRNLLERSLLRRAETKKGMFDSIPIVGSALELGEDIAEAVGDFIHPDEPGVGESRQDALKDAMQRTADEERDLLMRVEREVTALNASTESYAKALAENHNQRMQILRLRTHVKQNILYYMQAVWNHEPPDQRYLRLHEVPVPTFRQHTWFRFAAVTPARGAMTAYAHRALSTGDRTPTAVYEAEVLTDLERLDTRPLAQVADLGNLLGYFGNLMIFALKEPNPLTEFMAEPYVLHGFEELVDPDDPGNWTLDEFADYVCRLRERSTDDEFETVRPLLREQYERLLKDPLRSGEEIVVPTGSLFIEALPAATSLLERFKTLHRAIDVKKAQAEVRRLETETLRMVDRILHGEREDPDVEKRIVFEGVPAPVPPLEP